MIDVVCDACGKKFRVKNDAKNPVKCKLCQSPIDVPELRGPGKASTKGGTKCPVCGKHLAAGVKFCAACGTSSIGAEDVHVAGWKADRHMENMKFMHRFLRLFRWW